MNLEKRFSFLQTMEDPYQMRLSLTEIAAVSKFEEKYQGCLAEKEVFEINRIFRALVWTQTKSSRAYSPDISTTGIRTTS